MEIKATTLTWSLKTSNRTLSLSPLRDTRGTETGHLLANKIATTVIGYLYVNSININFRLRLHRPPSPSMFFLPPPHTHCRACECCGMIQSLLFQAVSDCFESRPHERCAGFSPLPPFTPPPPATTKDICCFFFFCLDSDSSSPLREIFFFLKAYEG